MRLDDPDVEVREEAAKALGRIGSADAVDALLRHLTDPFSIIRPQAARALGRIGDRRAVEPLVAALGDPSEELQEACCQALGRMGAREALAPLLGLLASERSDRVAAAAGDAMSRLGAFEAALDLLPRMHATANRGLRRQFAIALGNLLGKPGAFYPYLTGDRASRAATLSRLFAESQRNVTAILNAAPESFESSNTREAVSAAMATCRPPWNPSTTRASRSGCTTWPSASAGAWPATTCPRTRRSASRSCTAPGSAWASGSRAR